MSVTTLSHFKFVSSIPQIQSHVEPSSSMIFKTSRTRRKIQIPHPSPSFNSLNLKLSSIRPLVTRISSSSDSGDTFQDGTPQKVSDEISDNNASSSPNSGDSYVGLFIRMLGLDNDLLDREQAVDALWKYSLSGKQCVDTIMKSPNTVFLTVNLLNSESNIACEAASGLLRMISSVNIYRDLVAENGAIQEITSLLRRSSLTSEVKEQSLCVLANLSVDEKLRLQIANSDILPLIIKFLDDEDMKVIEAAGGVLANLALSVANHKIMVETGVIPPLAKFLRPDSEGSKIIKKEAEITLLELSKDDYYKILLIEEGLVLVPLVGARAYKSFRPSLHSWPSLPDGSELNVKQTPKTPSRFGASELLLGLHVEKDEKNAKLEEAKKNAIVGRTQQQFLARIGAIEKENENENNEKRFTILPWVDGVARLVLILELDDESAVVKAADAIADVAVSEHMRCSFMEAGAVRNLIRVIENENEFVKLSVVRALERLSVSNDVCKRIEAEGVLEHLIKLLKDSDDFGDLTCMILNILARILDPGKQMKSKFYDAPVNGSKKGWNEARTWQTTQDDDLSDSIFLSRLIQILKTSSSFVLQTKAASILEYLTTFETCKEKIVSLDIESALNSLFQHKFFTETESENDFRELELQTLETEEAGRAVSTASRLLTRLLDSQNFQKNINVLRFTNSLRKILTSKIPLQNKDWVAACLIKLGSQNNLTQNNPINTDIIIYETIPRLIEQIKDSYAPEIQENAVFELNRIVSEGVVEYSRAVANNGGIFAIVKAVEEGNDRVVEGGLAVLYNLSMEAENHPAMVAAGVVPVLRRIVVCERVEWVKALHLLRMLPT
ncbi:hypothetical protein L1887_43726 [Cichorium endivia]|nr:hypothetical protein L1887_43726 [Cichorium endivia]